MAIIGRVLGLAFDAVLVSTVLAGVRRTSGFAPDSNLISDTTMRSVAERFLGVGESVFDVVQATAVNSAYFRRSST
ncbi:hypothetical protein EYR40_007843 [Pleurotus pulmonarius]|uniref:DUF1748-domain-containing protein n=2 Tax=Pleurotus ostreatus TaxID=5322 RepID=A0A067N9R1_PLEO1|nr:uncharacterized protein PC9H_009647 [Pleurotus ostreatus]KAF4596459.1 hypothetical protein EYR38_007846 [Pleurotus pulmonarius]KAF4597391.1 hypothetical protein EYR40_007843 [Pleurotus pulmonarius]KAF7424340.1 hypothetical protein PC9H_009647 [Pleurotus ostreatus]KDQ24594.1 hypothetical protein PLEOSDRAFT_1046870 [Pleurotus ostreatus PC15]